MERKQENINTSVATAELEAACDKFEEQYLTCFNNGLIKGMRVDLLDRRIIVYVNEDIWEEQKQNWAETFMGERIVYQPIGSFVAANICPLNS